MGVGGTVRFGTADTGSSLPWPVTPFRRQSYITLPFASWLGPITPRNETHTYLLRSEFLFLFIGRLAPSKTTMGWIPWCSRRFTRFMQKATYLGTRGRLGRYSTRLKTWSSDLRKWDIPNSPSMVFDAASWEFVRNVTSFNIFITWQWDLNT